MGAKQHFVPRAYLSAFTDPDTPSGQEPYLWVYERDGEAPYARSPRKVAVRTHYYSFPDELGDLNESIEELLSKIESQAIPVLRLLQNDVDIASLTAEQREALAVFIAFLAVRTPRFRDHIEKFMADIGKKVGPLSAQDPEYFERTMKRVAAAKGKSPPEDIERLRQYILSGDYDVKTNPAISLQSLLEVAPTIAEYVYRFNWRMLRAPSSSSGFLTSDHPLVLISTKKLPGIYGIGAGWETPWMEATLPIAPRRCLLISQHHPPGFEEVSDSIVSEVNLRTAAHAAHEVYSSVQIDAWDLNRPAGWEWWAPVSSEFEKDR